MVVFTNEHPEASIYATCGIAAQKNGYSLLTFFLPETDISHDSTSVFLDTAFQQRTVSSAL
jgi:hypothetical protein